jgi:hypothetical protein
MNNNRMSVDRTKLYKFPWSKTDNQCGWIEVTDFCNLHCRGCYRHRLDGHRPLEEIKEDIRRCQELTNCDGMAIAGGEPLQYPEIVEVVRFIKENKMKPVMLSNGVGLTGDLLKELKKAGLMKIHFHVDSNQDRPDWNGTTEIEMNDLRQHFADLLYKHGGVQCGFHITVCRSSFKYIPDIIKWSRRNMHKIQHISLIALRGIPIEDDVEYYVNGRKIADDEVLNKFTDVSQINITTEEMYDILKSEFPDSDACAYLNGLSIPEINKYIVIVYVGSRKKVFGVLGRKTIEIVQVISHLFTGKYLSFFKNPVAGRKLFLLSKFDSLLKKTFINYLREVRRKPSLFLNNIYTQTIALQQPIEFKDGKKVYCDPCVNFMVYKNKLINPCQLDEYRLLGSPIEVVKINKKTREHKIK